MKIKKMFVLFISLLTMFCLTACNGSKYNVTYLTGANINPKSNDITLLNSESNITSYLAESRFFDAGGEFIDKVNGYDASYFENKSLIIINIMEISSLNELTVKKVDITESEIKITIQ